MKKVFLNILSLAFVLTTIALVMDGDMVKPSMMMRFVEFFGMMGIFTLFISVIYFSTTYLFRNIEKESVKQEK
ncbi:MAG TPA: hypothetical protein VKY82_06815 [Flavobacterium sp.]|nr:hypothetical protein [Flavobacterium sp.]